MCGKRGDSDSPHTRIKRPQRRPPRHSPASRPAGCRRQSPCPKVRSTPPPRDLHLGTSHLSPPSTSAKISAFWFLLSPAHLLTPLAKPKLRDRRVSPVPAASASRPGYRCIWRPTGPLLSVLHPRATLLFNSVHQIMSLLNAVPHGFSSH